MVIIIKSILMNVMWSTGSLSTGWMLWMVDFIRKTDRITLFRCINGRGCRNTDTWYLKKEEEEESTFTVQRVNWFYQIPPDYRAYFYCGFLIQSVGIEYYLAMFKGGCFLSTVTRTTQIRSNSVRVTLPRPYSIRIQLYISEFL